MHSPHPCSAPRLLCVLLFALCGLFAARAAAQLKVDAPVNNSVVNSPFYLQADATSCHGQPTASMAYSLDSGSDVVSSGVHFVHTTIPTADGAHVLHVKAWGSGGALCEQSLSLIVGGGIALAAPAVGAEVTSPFVLEAQASTCGGQATRGLHFVLDGASRPYNPGDGQPQHAGPTSIDTSVNASRGGHLLRVEAWGDSGAHCETDADLFVSDNASLQPPSNAQQYAHLENDGTYTGAYASCGGATGPSNNLWQTQPDCGTVGTKTGSTSIVSTPVFGRDTDSRQFTMTFDQSGGGVRWFDAKAADDAATHFQYDAWVYVADVSTVMNIEMDINHAILTPSPLVYIMASQCNMAAGFFQVTANGAWVNTNVPCTTSQIASGVWHHFQIRFHHDAGGGVTVYYDAVAIDGHEMPITTCTNASTGATLACQNTATNLGWGGVIGPNFQLDGSGAGGNATAYTDDFSIYYW